ncbi:hypothetical protein UF06_09125 [Vibrio sp. S234-5]|nr:hypothetical protein UF06_09125 [Vibrio sp. S234-5]
MFASISFGAGLLSNQRTQSVERASYPIISHLLKALLGLILESLNHCNCGFWSCKFYLSH